LTTIEIKTCIQVKIQRGYGEPKKALTTRLHVKLMKKLKFRVMARLTPESILGDI
jgi:hypothetical protein